MSKRKPYPLAPKPEGAPSVWKSLEEKAAPEVYQRRAAAELPVGFVEVSRLVKGGTEREIEPTIQPEVQPEVVDGIPLLRRGFLSLAGATAGFMGLEGCIRRPAEKILPFTKGREYAVPGIPVHYASTLERRGDAIGILVTSHEGRPTKIEGNTEHPSSLGSTDLLTQAAILDLYDPDRSDGPRKGLASGKAETITWVDFEKTVGPKLEEFETEGGAGLHCLMQPSTSPTVARLKRKVLERFPKASFHTYAPVDDAAVQQGAKLAFGKAVHPVYEYDKAKVILSLDSDFLGTESGNIRSARQFSNGRRLRSPDDEMNRLYVVESVFSLTGANADHRLRLAGRDMAGYAAALIRELSSAHGISFDELQGALPPAPQGIPTPWIKAVAKDLAQHRGRSVVVVGARQPAALHALAHALNEALGNVGTTVRFVEAPEAAGAETERTLADLSAAIGAGSVKALLLLGGNPAFDAPADHGFGEKLKKVPLTLHLSSHIDETSKLCLYHLPRAHPLETWGDSRALDGTWSVQQPLIAPLRGGRSDIELLAWLAGETDFRGHAQVRQTFASSVAPVVLERTWKKALHAGVVEGSAVFPTEVVVQKAEVAKAISGLPRAEGALGRDNLEVHFTADYKLWDGRHANNPWLLELPDPLTRITWDNAALLSPDTAKALSVVSGDVIRISNGSASVEIVVWILPGMADYCVNLPLGWGRRSAGRYGNDHGFNVYPLRTAAGLHFASGFRVQKVGKRYPISQTQEHGDMEGRPIAIDDTLARYRETPSFPQFRSVEPKTSPLWREVEYKGHKWGMAIDLNACIGCNACSVACQSENNIAVVGKEQVARGREMHWLRIDRYFVGESEQDPNIAFQPVACVHCEEAPCENVCPVNATAHSPEGLNEMAYNRCIGTRYCSNNCPYKVRRFNFLDFHGDVPEEKRMQFNPNVTVRMRGVMEKCTYCVQRIQSAKIVTKRNDKTLQDGDITPACAQACPTEAIVFGDLNDKKSRVAALSGMDRGYKLLAEIGTQPRTTYLAKIRNLNPEMQG